MTVTETDLSTESDVVLDATLQKIFRDHRAAADAGDVEEKRVLHEMAASVIAEQSRRLDVWLAEHR